MKDPEWAFLYAKNIIGGRWPEAEEFIFKNDAYTIDTYKQLFIN